MTRRGIRIEAGAAPARCRAPPRSPARRTATDRGPARGLCVRVSTPEVDTNADTGRDIRPPRGAAWARITVLCDTRGCCRRRCPNRGGAALPCVWLGPEWPPRAERRYRRRPNRIVRAAHPGSRLRIGRHPLVPRCALCPPGGAQTGAQEKIFGPARAMTRSGVTDLCDFCGAQTPTDANGFRPSGRAVQELARKAGVGTDCIAASGSTASTIVPLNVRDVVGPRSPPPRVA